MELHAEIGGECIQNIEKRLGSSNFLQMAREIAFAHHERWDGTGYPKQIAGEEIPLSGTNCLDLRCLRRALDSTGLQRPVFAREMRQNYPRRSRNSI